MKLIPNYIYWKCVALWATGLISGMISQELWNKNKISFSFIAILFSGILFIFLTKLFFS